MRPLCRPNNAGPFLHAAAAARNMGAAAAAWLAASSRLCLAGAKGEGLFSRAGLPSPLRVVAGLHGCGALLERCCAASGALIGRLLVSANPAPLLANATIDQGRQGMKIFRLIPQWRQPIRNEGFASYSTVTKPTMNEGFLNSSALYQSDKSRQGRKVFRLWGPCRRRSARGRARVKPRLLLNVTASGTPAAHTRGGCSQRGSACRPGAAAAAAACGRRPQGRGSRRPAANALHSVHRMC